jgi:DNA-binding NtrC family response regulator
METKPQMTERILIVDDDEAVRETSRVSMSRVARWRASARAAQIRRKV